MSSSTAPRAVSTADAPAAIGPYSQAIVADGWVYTAGQIALDAASGQLVGGGPAEQTRQVFANLRAVLAAAGCGFEHVVKATVFLSDMRWFAEVNEVYGAFFTDHKPARSTVAVAGLPREALVEIELVARAPDAAGSPTRSLPGIP